MANNFKESIIVNPIIDPTELDSNPELGQALSSLGKNASRSVELSTSPYIGGMQGAGESQYDIGLPKSLFSGEDSLAKTRGESQPWYDQAASFLNQAVVGEIVGGTIMTAGAIVGIPELIYNVVDKGEFDFSNKLFEVGKDISDWTQDVTPIYQTGERFADTGWWFQNGVSVASSASMLLPGMAVAKGVGLVGKALKLGVTATNMLSTGLGAVAMRHSENFREAHDVFKQAYDIAIQQGKSETEARKIAAESASLDYTANYANLVFDVIQLGSVLKPFAGLTRNIAPIAGKVASAADEAIGVSKYVPTTIKGKIFDRIVNPAKTGLAEWTEGIEEGINSISQLEAIRQAKIKSGAIKDDGSALPERIGKYLGEAEVQDAMLWGLIGGVAFKGLASATGFDESKGIAKNKIAELGERKQVIDYYSKVLKDLQAGTGEYKDQEKYPVAKRQELIQNVKDNFIQDLTFRAAEAGNVDILLAQIEDGNFVDKLVESGIGTKEEIKTQIPELVSKVKSYEDVYAKTYAKFYEQPMSSITKKILMNDSMDVELNIKKYTDRQQKLSKNINELLSKDTWYNAQENKSDIDIAIRQYSLGFAKLSLEYQLKNSPKNSDSSLLQKAIDKISKEIETASKTSKPIDIETIDNRVLQASVENTALEFYNGELLKHFEEISNPENIKNKAKVIDKAISKNKKTIADVIQNSSVTEAAKERKEAAAKVNGVTPPPSIDTKSEVVNEEDLNKDLTESVGEMFGEDVVAKSNEKQTETNTGEQPELETNKADIEIRRQELESSREIEILYDLRKPIAEDSKEIISKIEEANELRKNAQVKSEQAAKETDEEKRIALNSESQSLNEKAQILDKEVKISRDSVINNTPIKQAITSTKILGQKLLNKIKLAAKSNEWVSSMLISKEEFTKLEDATKRLSVKGMGEVTSNSEVIPDILLIEEINAKYDAELAALESKTTTSSDKIEISEKEKDLADIDSAINSQVSDGEAISVKEEDLGENDFESKKRLYGSAINYLTQAYNVTSGMMGKRTLDSSTADPIGLSASEWQNFKPGEEVELSLDTGFSGEVDLYDARGKRIRNSDGTIAKQFKTFEQIANEDLLDAPIKIEAVRNGKKVVVGYFPSIKWLSATDWTSSQAFENLANTDEVPAQAEIDKVKAIRELISKATANQVFKFKVDDTNLGNLNKSTDKSLAPVSKALPNLTKAPYFNKRGIKPFVIFNKGFRTSPDTLFEGNIALSEDYKKSVEAKGTGGLFMMIPSAKEGIFIPTPVSIPTVTPETAKALTTIIGDYKLNPESPSLTEAGKQTGINIKTNKALKDFLSGYVYISKQSPTGYNDSIPRIIFDTEKSEIILHKGREDKKNTVIQLNNLKNLTPQVLQSTLQELESFITKNKITVKHSLLNSSDTLSIPQTIDGKITYKETTLQDYLADNIQTNLRELVTENGTPVYATQPVVYISPKEVLDAIKPAVEKIVNEGEPIVFDSPFDESLEGLPSDPLLSLQSDRGVKDVNLESKYFGDSTTQSASSVLTKIANSGHPLSKLALKLLPYVRNISDVQILLKSSEEISKEYPGDTIPAGLYDNNKKIIIINKDSAFRGLGSEPTILHEILHSLTYDALLGNTEILKDFTKLYNHAKELFPQEYAVKDLNEFIVGLFTDGDFINKLIKSPAINTKKYKNSFEEILDFILSLFNITKGSNLYTEAFSVAGSILDNANEYSIYQKQTIQEDSLISNDKNIKPGVSELFESNPELANKVYEALGFNDNNFELKENKEAFGKEPHPEGANSYDIFSNGKKIGKIALFDGKNITIKGVNLNESERNKGLGKALYKWLNYKATLKGGRLYSDTEFISPDAQKVWESLNKEGLVDLTGNSPKFNDKQKQQAQQLYSQYLDTIFPDSKVKDIVYHATNASIEFFDKAKISNNTLNYGFYGKGFYFNETKDDLINWWRTLYKKDPNIVASIINTKNPYKNDSSIIEENTKLGSKKETEEFTNNLISQKYDSVLPQIPKEQGSNEYVVFEPEQIHILSSKADIQGFKSWVDNNQSNVQYQLPQGREQEEFVASEKTIRDLAARMSDRIGIPVRFESDRSKEYKGKLENGTAVINLAYATLDTPIHEILGHPIIRAIRDKSKYFTVSKSGNSWIVVPKGKNYSAKMSEYKAFKTEKEANDYINNNPFADLYNNLLKELETGKGKEVLDRIKRDYTNKNKYNKEDFSIQEDEQFDIDAGKRVKRFTVLNSKNPYAAQTVFKNIEDAQKEIEILSAIQPYTLEEQQEEAIVELLGLMTAEKLDNVKDGKLISLLKRLLKEMKQFVRSLINQKEVEIDKLPDNMTLGDIADLLAYSNSKLILPGNEVVYTTPDNQQFKTYAEASNHISELAKSVKDVDLDKPIEKYAVHFSYMVRESDGGYDEQPQVEYFNSLKEAKEYSKRVPDGLFDRIEKIENFLPKSFIDKNKEYEQSKEIIEEWKKVNNIQYNPEEIYSRGQEFSSVVGAYSDFDVNLMLQNLLSHIEDNQKAGGKFAISAYTKPIDKQIGHLEGGGGKIKFKLYPQSEDILWAANTDVYSGSVWDASEKVNKDKKSELLGVSYTKYPSLRNVNTVQPNLASIIDNLAHYHNELGISLTGNNFRLEYDEDIPYTTKKLIDSINSILDQKYGKLVKPDLSKKILKSEKVYEVRWKNSGGVIIRTTDLNKAKAEMQGDYTDAEGNKLKPEDVVEIVEGSPIEQIGIQPTQTNETLKESIESVKSKNTSLNENKWAVEPVDENEFGVYTFMGKPIQLGFSTIKEADEWIKKNKHKEKEYTEQALTNTKIAKLKEVAKKYPRSLIRSEVRPIPRYKKGDEYYEPFKDELPFQKVSEQRTEIIELSKDVLITDGTFVYSSQKQLAITKSIASVVFGEFIKADKEGSKLFVNKTFDIAKKGLQGRLDNFRKLYALGEKAAMELIQKTPNMKFIGTYKNLEYLITEHERILKDNVWKQFENQVLINLNRLGISVKNNSISDMSFEEIEENKLEESIETDSTIEGNDGRFEKSLNELSTFQSDGKNTAGWRVKMELSKIRSGKINYLGIAEYLPFDTVFDDLQNILSLVEGDIDKYINELSETVKDNNPKWYLNDVIKLLNDPTTPWSTKNNFISVMQRAHNEFKLLVWKRDAKGWTLNIIDSNRNSVINKVLDTWNENFKAGKLVIKDPVKGMSIDKEAIKSLYSKFIEVNLEDMASIEGFLKNILFPELGIVLPESAMKELLSKNLEYIGGKSYNIRGNIKQQFRYTSDGTSSDGIISHIIESLRKDVVIPEEDDTDALTFNNPFVGENSEKAIKFLAKLSAKHGLKMDTNTFRNVESKMIYAYSFFIPEKLRINDLNSNQTLRDSLSNNPLTKFSTYLKLLNEGSKLEHNYMDGMVQSGRSASGITRQSMSYREQLLTAIAHFQSDLNTPSYVGLTHSDKTVTSVVKFKKHAFNLITSSDFNGVVTVDNLPNATIKEIRNLVLAEISRIQNFLEKKNTFITPNTHGEQYYKGAEYFYFFPKLNDLVRGEDGNIIPQNLNDIDALTNKALEDVVATINETVKEFQDKGIVTKFKDSAGKFTDNYSVAFKQSYIASILSKGNITQGFTESETKLLLAQAAADMDINYMIHNANMMMLVHGDPALFFKKDVTNTLIEYQKRLAKDAAPGALGHYKWKIGKYEGKRLYNVVIANDITHGTLTEGYISKLEAYTKKIDRTDAQEYTTVEEHLMVLASYGRINDVMFIQMMDKIQKGKQDKTYDYEFDDDELAVILQPLKPVQIYYDDIANESNVNTMYYIKSSSFPLLPKLTKGTDLDKVRIAMERDDVQRLAFKTAVKTGHKKLATIANADGSIKDDLSFESNINQLDRGAFSIQQDVPYEKGKHRILTLSQMNKLLFEGLSDLEFDYNGKKVSGLELKKHKEAIRSKLFELSADELYNRLGIKIENGSPTITDYSKLVEAIKQEAISRNWGINDIDTLRFKDGNFIIPLGFNNSAARIEALVLSMFTNTIIKQKINGKSLVQGSPEGFRNNVKTLEELADTSGIVFIKNADTTKNFNPAKGLTTSTVIEEGNVVIRAQVLIPWKFAGKLKDFVKDGFLDLEKVDPELLHLIGARIPNQGHSSQIALQVVGFIPENMGDLILVPGEITRQMGADFDVDKLYTYIYNNILNDDGKLIIIPNLLDTNGDLNKKKYFRFLRDNFSKTLEKNAQLKKFVDDQVTIGELFKQILSGKEEKNSQFEDFFVELDSIKLFGMEELGFTKEELKKPSENFLYRASLENEYIRIHNIVLTHPEVVKKSTNPLDKEDLKITGKVGRKIDKGGNFLTFRRQLLDHLSQKAGKDGVGVFSRAVVGATVLQDYNLKLGYTNKEGDQVLTPFTRFGYLKDGKVVSFNLVKLSGTAKSYFDGLATEMRSKVDNIITQQSGSVDNAKEQVLADNNLNMTTFNVSIALSMLQEDGANGKALDITYNTYLLKQEIIYDFVNEITKLSDTLNEDYTPDKIEEVKYILTKKYLQRIGLPEYEVTGKAFTREDMKSLLETEDTSSISYVKDQLELLDSFLLLNSYGQELSEVFTAISVDSKGLGKSYWESNLKEIRLDNLGNKSLILNTGELLIDSEMGKLAQYVREANIILAELFPYASPHITNILGYLEGMSGRQDNINLEFRQAAWEAIKMYSYRNTNLDIYTNREELSYGDNSLAKRIQKFKGTELGASNLFILKLRTVLATKVGNPDLVTFSASSAERTDESDVIKHFIDLFINEDPEVVQLAEDLVKYAFASGGIQKALEYIKYIPTSYLLTTNFGRVLSAINGSLYSESDFFDDYRFIEQFLQHNPQYARKYNSSSTPSKNRMVINSQEAANKYMMTIYKDGKLVSTAVPFITYRNVKTNEWWLYRLSETPKEGVDGESVGDFVYTRIGLLGGKGKDLTSYKEYEFDSEPTSLIPSNNVENAPVTITNTNSIESETPPVPVPSKENNLTKPNSQAKEMLVNEYFTNDIGKKALENLRETFTSSRFGALLDYLIDNSDYMSEGFSIKLNNKLTNHLGVPVRGIYKPDTNTIEINIKKIEQFLNKKGLTLNSDSIEQAIMHEVFHGFTSKLYNDWKMGKTLPANVVKALTQIEVLFNMANRALTDSSKADVALLKQAIASGNMDLLPQDFTEDFINKFYGFTSPKEFIAEIFSNPEFQEIINNIESDKNFLQRFFEIIKKLFQGIKENSLLNESMNEVLSLIDVANKEFRLSTTTQQSTETINIYAGTNENAELSNFYIRPFELSKNLLDFLNKQGSDYSGINYKSVEQAFQNIKVSYNNTGFSDTLDKDILSTTDGGELRKLGRKINLDETKWNKDSSYIMKELMLESFKQNSDALAKLLDTGNATLTHKYKGVEQDKGRFSKLLMEVRDELRAQQSTTQETSIIPLITLFDRNSVQKDSEYIYLFTDNAQRTSGSNLIPDNSRYSILYGKGKKYPTMTQAIIRGLNNAFPITTMVDDKRTQWTDDRFNEYKEIIDNEIGEIKAALNVYKGIKFSTQMPFGQGKISNMKETAPKIWNYLNQKLLEIGINNTKEIPTTTQEIKQSPITQTQEYYGGDGNFYKFDLQDGVPIKGYYKQSSTGVWNEMNNKKIVDKYNTLVNKATQKPVVEKSITPVIQKTKESANINTFTFEDGIVIDTGDIVLNSQQKEALQLAVNAINDKTTKFVLRGYAGTGKSTVSKFIEAYVNKKNKGRKTIKYAAPTHKAKTVLEIMLIRGKNNKKPITVAKLLNIRKIDGSFVPGPKNLMPSNGLVIIDEGSMINDSDYSNIMELAKANETTVIFMGDPAQLPPVGKNSLSKALEFNDKTNGIELTEIMRQDSSNPILEMFTSLRQNLSNIIEQFPFVSKQGEKGSVEWISDYKEFFNKTFEAFSSEEFENDPTYAKIISYTNKAIRLYNDLIVSKLKKDGYAEGSILMGYEQVSPENTLIHNGQDYIVESNEYEEDTDITVYEGKLPDGMPANIQAKVSGYRVVVKRIFSPEDVRLVKENSPELLTPLEIYILNPFDRQTINFMKEYLRLRAIASDPKISWMNREPLSNYLDRLMSFYQLPDEMILYEGQVYTMSLLKSEKPELFKRDKDGATLFDKNTFKSIAAKNIDYGYAVTAHKAQGSTYKNVFVDYQNMNNPLNNNPIYDKGILFGNERNMLKYVASSRATENTYFLYNKGRSVTSGTAEEMAIINSNSPSEFEATIDMFSEDALIAGRDNLGMSVGEFMKTLNAKEREYLRNMINNKEIKFKCR